MDPSNSSNEVLQHDERVRLNDVVLNYMVQHGFPFVVDHYTEIRESYYQQMQTTSVVS
jgi:hypothetical protein